MPAPTYTTAQLPAETGNTGKLIRLLARVVGGQTRHDHVHVPVSRRNKVGVYYYTTPLQSVLAAAQDGTTTAAFWLQNPIANTTKHLVLREIALRFNNSAATIAATTPRILLQRFTFSGTASGASITPSKRDTTDDADASGFARTAFTGMAITLGAGVNTFLVPIVMSAVGNFADTPQAWPHTKDPLEDDGLVIRAGHGVVLYQADAGTATDPRRFVANFTVDEIEA